MRKYLLIIICISVPRIFSVAQDPIVATESTSLISIGKQIDVLEDPGGKLTLQEILSPQYQSQFKRSLQEVPNFGTKQTCVWSRIKIKSIASKDWFLNVDFPNTHNIKLFQSKGDGNYVVEETGRGFPFSERKIKNRSFIFKLQLDTARETEIYLRIENHICIFPLYVGDMTAISEKQHPEDLLYGIFYGISFIIAFYAIALFIATRERYYLYFFFQVIFFCLYGMIYCGDAARWLPNFALPVTDYGTVIISTGIIFVYLFFNAVLKTRMKIPAASRTFMISATLTAIAILVYFAGNRPMAAIINQVVSSAVFISAIILCFFLKKENILRLIFIGFAVGFAVLIFWILMLQNIIPYSRLVNNLLIVQYMWWMIIFSLALELNINNYIKEKYKAQKEALKNLAEKEKIIQQQNEILEQKVEERTRELKEMQTQLIQREKMASLGELTAGIAHEIQNPLNFVNNFSDINKELIVEMKTELKSGNSEAVFSIADNIEQNEQKINHHGKRADEIVKGMLQHSRKNSGQIESTDINALADEYLRLSFHGLRAKDKTFDASSQTKFDDAVMAIKIVPQDIGRVLLNLYNNAFYSVTEKKKAQNQLGSNHFEPTVSVTTNRVDGMVEIRVYDNGTGIPEKAMDKIFNPFYTTKPTGQGTGLGLSLSYDIIKAHGGDLKVNTKEGEYAEFVICLPA